MSKVDTCPVCGGTFAAKKDGTVRRHRGDIWQGPRRLVCSGSGAYPRPPKVEK